MASFNNTTGRFHSPLLAWKDDIIAVKNLYREGKYRRCAALCSELLPAAEHPLHSTFLFFYQAICFESLGHISHNYSSNKISLLEQALDAFISAKETLPQPYLNSLGGADDVPKPIPVSTASDALQLYADNNLSVLVQQSSLAPPTTRQCTAIRSSTGPSPTDDEVSVASTVPSFDGCSPRRPLRDMMANLQNVQSQCLEQKSYPTSLIFLTPGDKLESDHKTRLSRSLSSHHNLAEELVPSPLFNRRLSSIQESHSAFADDNTFLSPLVSLSKPFPLTPKDQPLPALPFNHRPHVVQKGKGLVLVPRRKTALATLISKFEGQSPFDSPSPDNSEQLGMVFRCTPTTDRFKRISVTFGGKDEENESLEPRTLQDQRNTHNPRAPFDEVGGKAPKVLNVPFARARRQLQPSPSSQYTYGTLSPMQPLSPASRLETCNEHLASFRTAIIHHINNVSNKITQVREVQKAHEAEKRERFANMNSRYSSSIPTSPTKQKPGGRVRVRQASPAKDARLRSFWSLQIASAQAKADRGSNWADKEKAKERRQRIERLRSKGWKGVCKEAKGWKGAEHYEQLRRQAEQELGCL